MKIVNTSLNQAETLNHQLETFIQNFEQLTLTQRLDQSNTLFDSLKAFFSTQSTILEFAFNTKPAYRPKFETFESTHKALLETYQCMVMLHVEETVYKNELKKLHDAFAVYLQQPYEDFMCQVQADFTEADEEAITALLKKTVHA